MSNPAPTGKGSMKCPVCKNPHPFQCLMSAIIYYRCFDCDHTWDTDTKHRLKPRNIQKVQRGPLDDRGIVRANHAVGLTAE